MTTAAPAWSDRQYTQFLRARADERPRDMNVSGKGYKHDSSEPNTPKMRQTLTVRGSGHDIKGLIVMTSIIRLCVQDSRIELYVPMDTKIALECFEHSERRNFITIHQMSPRELYEYFMQLKRLA